MYVVEVQSRDLHDLSPLADALKVYGRLKEQLQLYLSLN